MMSAAQTQQQKTEPTKEDRDIPLVIWGRLPSSESVRSFVEDVSRDINIARKIGTYASSLLVEALSSEEDGV
jgi:hypothetical protein